MKKYLTLTLSIIILLIAVGCIFAGCSGNNDIQIVLSVQDDLLSWSSVENADLYYVNIYYTSTVSSEISTTERSFEPTLTTGTYVFRVRARVNGKKTGYSNSITYEIKEDGSKTIYLGDKVGGEVIYHNGVGTEEDPICVYNANDLKAITTGTKTVKKEIGSETISLYYKQMSDIDISGEEWTPIGNGSAFEGIYDGCGHKVSGLTISSMPKTYKVGLFGNLNGATIKNLRVTDSNINIRYSGAENNVGILCGYAKTSTIEKCSVENGNINMPAPIASTYICFSGMITGTSYGTKIDQCYASGNIEISYSKVYAGGIAGYLKNASADIISNCYSKTNVSVYGTGRNTSGSVVATAFAGGLVGYVSYAKSIENCYAYGLISATAIDGTATTSLGKGFLGGSNGSSTYNRSSIPINNSYFLTEGVIKEFDKVTYNAPLKIGNKYGIGNRDYLKADSTLYGIDKDDFYTQTTFSGWNFGEIWVMDATPVLAWQK